MPAKKIKTRTVERSRYKIYLKRAEDFYATMESAFARGNWNSAGLEAVHCAISITDAILVYLASVRSSSEDHDDVTELLKQRVTTPGAAQKIHHLEMILALKHDIEYGVRDFSQREAAEVVKHTERYFEWAKSLLP